MPATLSANPNGNAATSSYDLLVIGAGPAGIHAALTAAECGLRVGLLDEAPAAGGQVWRAPPAAFAMSKAKPSPDQLAGAAARGALAASAVDSLFGRRVWNLRPGFEAHAVGPDGNEVLTAPAMVVAPGTVERIIPFTGSTLPGVIGLGAATVLLKAQGMLPGSETIVAGAGPLLAAVAVGIVKGGGRVAAVVDLNGPTDWARSLPSMLRRPSLLKQGLGWVAMLRSHGVPYYSRHAIVRAEGSEAVQGAVIAPVDRDWRLVEGGKQVAIQADAIAVGHGLSPSTELTRLLGAEHRFDAAYGEWVPVLDREGRTSVKNLFVAGDAAGVSGAAAAVEAGRQAGLAAARALGALNDAAYAAEASATTKKLAASRHFGRAMTHLTRLRPGLVAAMAPETTVCRCEDVKRRDIDAAIADGARSIGQLKAWTRCGMGPCQGRMCSEAVGALMAEANVRRETFGQMVARPPLRPVAIDQLSGTFTYEDIALPPSLPTS